MKPFNHARWQKKLLIAAILSQLILNPNSLRGDLTLIGTPFTGDSVETWEEFPVANP